MIDIGAMVRDPEFRQRPKDEQVRLLKDSQTRNSQEQIQVAPKRGWAMGALPVAGAVGGAVLGGMSSGPAAPVGAAAGAALGGGIGEEAAQFIEELRGQRKQADVGKTFRTAGEQGAMELLVPPVVKGAAQGLKSVGTRAVEALLPRTEYESGLTLAYRAKWPFWKRVTAAITGMPGGASRDAVRTTAETVTDKGLWGTEAGLGIRAKRATRSLWNDAILPALQRSKQQVHLPTFFDEVEQQILKDNRELARRSDLLEALQYFRDTYKGVGNVSMEGLQGFKEGWAKYVPEKAYQGHPITSAFNDVRSLLADRARDTLYNTLGPEIRQAYFDYGNLTNLIEHGKATMSGKGLRSTAGAWSAIKEKPVTAIGTAANQVVYRTAQGLELIGRPGARVARDVIPGLFEVGEPMNPPATPQRVVPAPTPTPAPTLPPGAMPLAAATGQAPEPQAQAELQRLNINLPPQTKIQFGGKSMEMPTDVAQKYHTLRKALVEQQVSAFMKHGAYQQASPETQRRIVQKTVSRMGRVAQQQLRAELGRALRTDVAKAPEAPDPSGP